MRTTIAALIVAWGFLETAQGQLPLIQVPDFEHGRVLAPGESTSLTVKVTDRQGLPLAGSAVLFLSPLSGPSGTFADATEEPFTNFRAAPDASGQATAAFRAGAESGGLPRQRGRAEHSHGGNRPAP